MTASVADARSLAAFVAAVDLPPEGSARVREEPQVQALVHAARAGDRAAFGELVVLYERAVFRAALAALGSREDAEDAAQEAFVVAWQKLPGFREEATFRTWLLTIAWRKAIDRRRARRLWWSRAGSGLQFAYGGGRGDQSGENGDLLSTVAGASPDPEQRAVSRDLARRVRTEIRRLSPKLRDAILLATSGEHTYEEIAAVLRIPLGTVKWRVSEARRILEERIGP